MRPDHLIEQAYLLLSISRNGQPRQADKKRAVSAAYYAVFHAVLGAFADQLVGKRERNSPDYVRAYRSVDHARLRKVCESLPKSSSSLELKTMGEVIVGLAQQRKSADYDPSFRISLKSARQAVMDAEAAMTALATIGDVERRTFVLSLAFSVRN